MPCENYKEMEENPEVEFVRYGKTRFYEALQQQTCLKYKIPNVVIIDKPKATKGGSEGTSPGLIALIIVLIVMAAIAIGLFAYWIKTKNGPYQRQELEQSAKLSERKAMFGKDASSKSLRTHEENESPDRGEHRVSDILG